MIDGPILALDLAINTGAAIGRAGVAPRSFSVRLKKGDEGQDVAFANLVAWLSRFLSEEKPALVFKEAMLPIAAFARLDSAAHTITFHAGLHAIVEALCVRHRIPWDERADATVRKHFCGSARFGGRAAAKRAVLGRCHMLGLLPRDCKDDNRADAIACHDWAAAHLARIPPKELVLFGEQARA